MTAAGWISCQQSETAIWQCLLHSGAIMKSSPSAAVSSSAPTEASMISMFVAIFTPVFAVAAGWFAGVIAQAVPGAHLDQNQIVAFMTAAAVSVITAGWKWLQGWQQHEALVAQGLDVPVKAGPPAAATAAAPAAPPAPVVSPAPS
jgi:hypothetical protein